MQQQEPLDLPLIAKVDFLKKPSSHPDCPTRIEAIETHMSWVFLTHYYAYKLKKPVAFDFLDYRTIEARRRFCEAEVTLNQRLAPGVYLGIIPLAMTKDGQLGLHGDGVVVDWLVQMRRLPAEVRLDAGIDAGHVDRKRFDEALRLLIASYKSERRAAFSPTVYRQRLDVATRRNEDVLSTLDQRRVIDRQLACLEHQKDMFAARAGHVAW